MNERQIPDDILANQQSFDFGSTTREIAVGTMMGGFYAGFGFLILSGFIGIVGMKIGQSLGVASPVAGSLCIWLALWLFPIWILLPTRPWWRFLVVLAVGAGYLAVVHPFIHQRDLGTFYPWMLITLPLGIALGVFSEPIRLARGGSTEAYIGRSFIGDRQEIFVLLGLILGVTIELLARKHQRIGAVLAGLLGGGLSALMPSCMVAWRGDQQVAELFFGSVWNITWACTTLGMLTGAFSGWWSVSIREHQQDRHERFLKLDQPNDPMP